MPRRPRWRWRARARSRASRRASGGPQPATVLALGAAAAFLAYPAAFAAAARGMPDVGGLVLVVCALRLAERLVRLLALRKGHDALIQADDPPRRRGAGADFTQCSPSGAGMRSPRSESWSCWRSRSPDGASTGRALSLARRGHGDGVGALTLLALLSPIVVGLALNLGAHDYAKTYAAYRKPGDAFCASSAMGRASPRARRAGWSGVSLVALARQQPAASDLLAGAATAAVLFLRIQTPYIHHLDLIAPAIVLPIAASLMILFGQTPRRPLFSASASLGVITLSPLAATLHPLGLAPIAGLPRTPRAEVNRTRAADGLGR